MDARRKKLAFRSGHRGTKEMDVIMGHFAAWFLPECSEEQLNAYEDLLNESDPDLYNWISMRETVPSDMNNPVLPLLIGYQVTK